MARAQGQAPQFGYFALADPRHTDKAVGSQIQHPILLAVSSCVVFGRFGVSGTFSLTESVDKLLEVAKRWEYNAGQPGA